MKSQGLPMSTIVILVIVIIVLVGVAIFFFVGFGQSGEGLSESQIVAQCQSKCVRAQSIARGISYHCNAVCGENPSAGGARGVAFCPANTGGASTGTWDYNCDEYVGPCEVTFDDGSKYEITCGIGAVGGCDKCCNCEPVT